MELLTADKALELLREVVAEFGPDYVYPVNHDLTASRACDYVREGKPSCIVAQVAYRFGIPVETMEGWDTMYSAGANASVALADFAEYLARGLLRVAQTVQDGEGTWGEALNAAEERMDEEKTKFPTSGA